MSEPRIRPAKPGDGPGCAEIWIDIGRYYHAIDPRTFQVPSSDGLVDSFEDGIADHNPDQLHLIAEIKDTVAGFLTAALHEPAQHPEHQLLRDLSRPRLFIQILAVPAQHRRTGVGTALMTAAETWAQDHDAATVSLDTYLHSPISVPFYENRMRYHRRAIIFRKELDQNPYQEST